MNAEERRIRMSSAAAGAVASVALWTLDLLGIDELAFAGARTAAVQERLVTEGFGAIVAIERDLLAMHAIFGAVFGLAVSIALCGARAFVPWSRRISAVVLTVFCLHSLALFGMIARYPQLFADDWWLQGGVKAALQVFITHSVGPWVFDVAFVALCSVLVLVLLWKGIGSLSPRARIRAVVAAALFSATAAAYRAAEPVRRGRPPEERSVLVIAVDSLRSDHLESEDAMPFASRFVRRGLLFRFAYTPIARTFPSWISMLSGLEPSQTGVKTMFPSIGARSRPPPTIMSELRDRDYKTFVVSDFAGDIFPRFDGGFEVVDAPNLRADTLVKSLVLMEHIWSLPVLRIPLLRERIEVWRNAPNLADPRWLVDRTLGEIDRERSGRPFAGAVFFSTAHFPYPAPYPFYRGDRAEARGPFLYHVPPNADIGPGEFDHARLRYRGALRAVDDAIERLVRGLEERELIEDTIIVVTSDHGEELFEADGVSGHGDIIGTERSQRVPIALAAPGLPAGVVSNVQVRTYDLPATILDLIGARTSTGGVRFGDGVSLLARGDPRPICVETGIWFWPDLPRALRGRRLEYEGIESLVEIDPVSRELVLRREHEPIVEAAKQRGIILGHRYYIRKPTPDGVEEERGAIPGIDVSGDEVDLESLYLDRCVHRDRRLRLTHGAVVLREDEGSR